MRKAKNVFPKFWVQLLVGGLWFIILTISGLTKTEPIWMQWLIYPILGLPWGFFYLHNAISEQKNISIGGYALNVLVLGPVLSGVVGVLMVFMAGAFYYIFKMVNVIIST